MKIKIIKESKAPRSEKEPLNELAPAVGMLLKQLAPMLLGAITGGGEKNAEENAEELVKFTRSNPLVTQSKDMIDIKQILQAIQAQLANIDVSVDTAATGTARGEDPEELDRAQKKSGRAMTNLGDDRAIEPLERPIS